MIAAYKNSVRDNICMVPATFKKYEKLVEEISKVAPFNYDPSDKEGYLYKVCRQQLT